MLNKTVLKINLQKFMDDQSVVFINNPSDLIDFSNKFSDCLFKYFSQLILPSSTHSVAFQVAKSTLLSTNLQQGNGAMVLEATLRNYVSSMILGIVGYASVPPLGEIGFDSIFMNVKNNNLSSEACCDLIASKIHIWALKGKSTLISPPNTVIIWN